MEQMASIDFFVVLAATFRLVFVVLSNARRRVLHFQVTEHPSQEWTMQQMREAFPGDHPCRYLLRDRDAIYGGDWVAMYERPGDGGSDSRTAFPMATSVRGAADWFHTAANV
jgi:hypothetical protein